MKNSNLTHPKFGIMQREDLIKKLEQKYIEQEQPMDAYLEGLLHAKAINYWDYIQVDALFQLAKNEN